MAEKENMTPEPFSQSCLSCTQSTTDQRQLTMFLTDVLGQSQGQKILPEGDFVSNLPPSLSSCWLAWWWFSWWRPQTGGGERTAVNAVACSRRNRSGIVLEVNKLESTGSEQYSPYWPWIANKKPIGPCGLLSAYCVLTCFPKNKT